MNITPVEELMYKVMKAIYESGIPIDFKGSMVLKACLMEAGYLEETRHTVDIDANWRSDTPPTAAQMVESLQKAIDRLGLDLDVVLYRMYKEQQSAGFDIIDRNTGEKLFSMDIDVNRWPAAKTKMYEVDGLRFRGVAPTNMFVDKIVAVSSDKIFSRVKDFVDLYYVSRISVFDKTGFLRALEESGRTLEDFSGFLNRKDDLRHAYEKFRFAGNVRKVPFDEVYSAVKSYIRDLLPRERNIERER